LPVFPFAGSERKISSYSGQRANGLNGLTLMYINNNRLRSTSQSTRKYMFKTVLGAVSDQKNAIGSAQVGKNFNGFAVAVLGMRIYRNFF